MNAALNLEPRMSMEELKTKAELNLEESAFYLGISRRTFYNSWRDRGLVGYRDHRGLLFFKRSDLDHYMKVAREIRRGH
jgi:excisionase family DNA binding protein